jgi:hypothetical protein
MQTRQAAASAECERQRRVDEQRRLDQQARDELAEVRRQSDAAADSLERVAHERNALQAERQRLAQQVEALLPPRQQLPAGAHAAPLFAAPAGWQHGPQVPEGHGFGAPPPRPYQSGGR